MKLEEIYSKWANGLTLEQLQKVVIEWCYEMEESESIRFGDIGNPYWVNSGESVVEGQKCFTEED